MLAKPLLHQLTLQLKKPKVVLQSACQIISGCLGCCLNSLKQNFPLRNQWLQMILMLYGHKCDELYNLTVITVISFKKICKHIFASICLNSLIFERCV